MKRLTIALDILTIIIDAALIVCLALSIKSGRENGSFTFTQE